jgi:hypothetical protein
MKITAYGRADLTLEKIREELRCTEKLRNKEQYRSSGSHCSSE